MNPCTIGRCLGAVIEPNWPFPKATRDMFTPRPRSRGAKAKERRAAKQRWQRSGKPFGLSFKQFLKQEKGGK